MKKSLLMAMGLFLFVASALPATAFQYTERYGHTGVYDQVEIFYVGIDGAAHIEQVTDYNRLALKWFNNLQNYDWYWKPEPWNILPINQKYFAGKDPVATQVVWPDNGDNFWSYFDLVVEIENAQKRFFIDVLYRSNKYNYDYEPIRMVWNGQYLTNSIYSPTDYDRTLSVPEPSTFVLLAVGIGSFALLRRKTRR